MGITRKKLLTSIFALGMVATTLIGCGSTNSGMNTNTSNSDKNMTDSSTDTMEKSDEMITLTFWRAGTDEVTEKYWLDFIDRYEAEHENIKVELTSIPWSDAETKLNVSYAGGTAPDILNYAIVSVPQRAGNGQYLNLDEYIANWEGKDDIYQKILDLGTYNESVYGIGLKPDPRIFVWRKDLFEEAGLDPETPPKNWEELRAFSEKLTKKENGITVQSGFQFNIANGFQDFQIFLQQNGGAFIDEKTEDPLFDQPEAVEALTFLNNFVQDDLVIPADSNQTGTDAFANGSSAMAYKNPSDIISIMASNPDLEGKIGMSAPLESKVQSTFCGLALQFISSDSKHPDEAWDFIAASMTKEEMLIRYELLNIPITRKSAEEEYIAANPEMNQAILDAINVGKGAYMVTYSNRLNEVISQAIEKVYYGEVTPEDGLKKAADDFRKEIPTLSK